MGNYTCVKCDIKRSDVYWRSFTGVTLNKLNNGKIVGISRLGEEGYMCSLCYDRKKKQANQPEDKTIRTINEEAFENAENLKRQLPDS